ncbi:MAG TPA: hypothetical protein VD772_09830 [Anseongella sp.]|nr:hypothetical protein [Anseongella sp.]
MLLLPLAGAAFAGQAGETGNIGKASGQDTTGQEAQAKESTVHIGLLYPLSSNGRQAAVYSNGFSFHVLMGLSREERKFVLSGVSTVVRENAAGLQIAGVSNYTGRQARGLQLAGVYNHVGDTAQGLQIGGVMNHAGSVAGLQVAGVMNHARKGARALQIGGVVNKAADLDGLQIGGVVNKAYDVKGLQFAGVLNMAKKVKGLQVAGLVNIADSSDYPLALLNFIRTGEKSIGLSTDETFNVLASFRSGGRVLYGILEAGYNLKSDEPLYALGGGLGAHIRFSEGFRINTELTSLVLDDFHRGEYSKHSLRILPALKLSDRIEVFAGPTVNSVYTDMQAGKDLFRNPVWEKAHSKGALHQWYAGFSGGLQIIL